MRRARIVQRAWVNWGGAPNPPQPDMSRLTAAQAAGIRYERKVFRKFERAFPHFISHLPVLYRDGKGKLQRIIPDGIIFGRLPDRITIMECKLRHSTDAWNQLAHLYLPVLREAFPNYRIKLLEVCRYFDPNVVLPTDYEIVRSLEDFEARPISKFGIHIYNPK